MSAEGQIARSGVGEPTAQEPMSERQPEQYSLAMILGVWAAAALPMALNTPRRVDVDDRRRGKRRTSPPASLHIPQPPGTRVDQAPYPQAPLSVLPYPDQRPLRLGGHREPPELPRIEGERAGTVEPLQTSGGHPSGAKSSGSARMARKTTGRSSSRSMLAW
jgi:hypothetical protein